jgi:hypothetical protein
MPPASAGVVHFGRKDAQTEPSDHPQHAPLHRQAIERRIPRSRLERIPPYTTPAKAGAQLGNVAN